MQYKKMIIAILQGEDYPDVVKDLNEHGFYVTLLNTTGGFLKKRSVTLMIGVEEEKLETATDIIKKHCSTRMENTIIPGEMGTFVAPVQVRKGGAVIFVLDIADTMKF